MNPNQEPNPPLKRLSFHAEDNKLVIKFGGQVIPDEKLEGLFEILTKDVARTAEALQKLYDATQPPPIK